MREELLQTMDAGVVERRNIPILPRAEAFEPRLAGVHDEGSAARGGDRLDEPAQLVEGIPIVDAEARLHGHRDRHRFAHGSHAVRHELGLGHQTSAEAARRHSRAGTADVHVHLVVPRLLDQARGTRHLCRVAAAKLRGKRVLARIEGEKAAPVAVQQGAARDHLRIQQHAARDEAQQVAGVPVRAVHHRRHADGPVHGRWTPAGFGLPAGISRARDEVPHCQSRLPCTVTVRRRLWAPWRCSHT